jgi:N5-(cytidine 5'-diphosphoramidyl)-L-glutamine hydrolase
MRKIAITMRSVDTPEYIERRDALDHRWINLLLQVDLWPILVPNNIVFIKKFVQDVDIDGLLLTGGNDLSIYGGDALERDAVENVLFEFALMNKIPVLGVCRGMQFIQNYFGVKLQLVENHVANRFSLEINPKSKWRKILRGLPDVNTYHDWGAYESSENLHISATSTDGVLMAVEHPTLPIFGHMWHPEREEVLSDTQNEIFQKIYDIK